MTSKLRLMIKEEAKPHILLVEDARDIREPLVRYLKEPDLMTRVKQWRELGRPESALVGVQYFANDDVMVYGTASI